MKTVKITYDEFLKLKSAQYHYSAIEALVCRKLSVKPSDIDDIDFNYKLTIGVYLKEEEDLDDELPF